MRKQAGSVGKWNTAASGAAGIGMGLLSKELLYMKFLQGIPVVGVAGGAFDVKYMKEITAYAELKYRKRYYRSFAEYDKI